MGITEKIRGVVGYYGTKTLHYTVYLKHLNPYVNKTGYSDSSGIRMHVLIKSLKGI